MLGKRSQVLEESITLTITVLANELKAKGEDVLSFSAGEPDFDTPQTIKNVVIKAIENGCSKYTPVAGIKGILNVVAIKLKRDSDSSYGTSEITTNVGAERSLFQCLGYLADEGDEVIIPNPYWVNYPEMVKFAGGKCVFVDTKEENSFKITADELKNALSEKTKVFILNTPSNPVGCIYTKEELSASAKVLEGTRVAVLDDEIYEKLCYDRVKLHAFANVSEDAMKHTVTISGLSKYEAMPGWRFGYMAGKIKGLVPAVKKLQGQSTSNICSISQYTATPALLGECDEDIEMMRRAFERRRNVALEMLSKMENISIYKPSGAFYSFINISKLEKDPMKSCQKLLEEKKVAVVPDIGFGMDGCLRLSYAISEENIIKGLERFSELVKNYKAQFRKLLAK